MAIDLRLDVHGCSTLTFASNRVTGGGLPAVSVGLGARCSSTIGLSLDLYKDPTGFINSVSFTAVSGTSCWTRRIAAGLARTGRRWTSAAGVTVGFAQHWKFSAEYVQFNFPNSDSDGLQRRFTLFYATRFLGLADPRSIRTSACSTISTAAPRSCSARPATPTASRSVSCRRSICSRHRSCR